MTVITGPAIQEARLLTLRAMLKLELKGMTRKGRSAYAILKEELKLKGSKQSVYDQVGEKLFKDKQLNLPLNNESTE